MSTPLLYSLDLSIMVVVSVFVLQRDICHSHTDMHLKKTIIQSLGVRDIKMGKKRDIRQHISHPRNTFITLYFISDGIENN